jgi:hypothetical protein
MFQYIELACRDTAANGALIATGSRDVSRSSTGRSRPRVRPEDDEVVGKVYAAESQLKYVPEPRDAHLTGSVRATVSPLLRELGAKVVGDSGF